MHLHTDTLRASDLQGILRVTGLAARGVYLDTERGPTERGSRKRARRITFYLVATDGYGRRWANSGNRGAGTDKAALYLEWGAMLGEVFHRDPDAIAGPYDGAQSFLEFAYRYANPEIKSDCPRTIGGWRFLYAQPEGVKVIAGYERMRSSVNGNPRFRFSFTDGTMLESMSDAGWAYAVGNPELREGSPVTLELTRAGKIRVMREA